MITAVELQEQLLQACSELHNVSVSILTDKVVVCDTLNEDVSFTVEILNKRFSILDNGATVVFAGLLHVQAYAYYRFALVPHYGYGINPDDAFGDTLAAALNTNWEFAYNRTAIADHDHSAAEMFLYNMSRAVLGPKTVSGFALFEELSNKGIINSLKVAAANVLYGTDSVIDTQIAIQKHLDSCVDAKQIQKACVSDITTYTITWKELYPNVVTRLYAKAIYRILKLFKVPFTGHGKASILKQLALFVTEHEIVYGEDSQEDVVRFTHHFPVQSKTRSVVVAITPVADAEVISVSINIVR